MHSLYNGRKKETILLKKFVKKLQDQGVNVQVKTATN